MDEPKKPRRLKMDPDTLYCSFCKKSQHEISKLIAGPKVFICDECIEMCNEIIAEEAFEFAKAGPAKLAAYILRQQEVMQAHRDRIIDATRLLGAYLAPGSNSRH